MYRPSNIVHAIYVMTKENNMDILDDILNTLNLSGALYFRTNFTGPWAITVPKFEQAARFHLVMQGKCTIQFPSGKTLLLQVGDMVLVPNGNTHIISDEPGRPSTSLETVLKTSNYNGNGVLVTGTGDKKAATQLICGHFNFRRNAGHPILKALPEYMLITGAMRAEQVWLDDILRLVVRRMFSGELGSTGVVTRLTESIFIELLRVGVTQSDKLQQVLQALTDKQLSTAFELMHSAPENSWTVQSLAKEAGMSRSRFADKFSQLMNIGPMSYLAEWRIQKALELLDKSQISIQQIAFKTGYKSPAAFSRAFAAKIGITPSEYRQTSA